MQPPAVGRSCCTLASLCEFSRSFKHSLPSPLSDSCEMWRGGSVHSMTSARVLPPMVGSVTYPGGCLPMKHGHSTLSSSAPCQSPAPGCLCTGQIPLSCRGRVPQSRRRPSTATAKLDVSPHAICLTGYGARAVRAVGDPTARHRLPPSVGGPSPKAPSPAHPHEKTPPEACAASSDSGQEKKIKCRERRSAGLESHYRQGESVELAHGEGRDPVGIGRGAQQ